MESFFELAFPDVNFSLEGDTKICCPFPHKDNGHEYYETNPSMSVNVDKGIYHCFSCGAKGNEIKFISEYMDVSMYQAERIKDTLYYANEDENDWKRAQENLRKNPQIVEMAKESYKFSTKAIKELKLGIEGAGKGISFPVFFFGKLVDAISYNPAKTPKYKKRMNAPNGLIMPYDRWKENTKKRTLIVAGQKDLGIAITYNFNAIAITGGEGTVPKWYLKDFKNRSVSIVYDNDEAGRQGAQKVAVAIAPYVNKLNIIDLSDTCEQKGEDLWDYFVKYGKSRKDLVKLIRETPEFSKEDYEKALNEQLPTVKLEKAVSSKYHNRLLRSNIQVIGAESNSYMMDTAITITDKDTKEKVYWNYSHERAEQMFYLIGGKLTDKDIYKNILAMNHIDKDRNVKIDITERTPVFRASVSDHVESTSTEDKVTEFNVYSLGHQLESGKRYRITYKLVPHPTQGKTLYLVVFDVESSQDSVTNFKIDEQTKQNLQKFQVQNTLTETIESHIEKVKGIVNADYDEMLLKLIDFWYHTPLTFNIGKFKNLRAYLDMLIIAESRVGKSSTVQALQNTYDLGTRIPLNGSNATIAGIIGGSHKTKNGFQVRAGAIPRAHKGAVIFEELMKAKQDILTELTEVRSSHQVMLTRVSGTINLPAYVRQLTLTNAKMDGGEPKPITSYPNGIEVVTDLVGTPEDIARYDVVAVLSRKGANQIDPFFDPPEPFKKEEYQDRIRWIWSREPKQINISKDVYVHTIQTANEINKDFDSYIKLFSTEAWLKIIRLAIAVAGYVVSTNDTYEEIVVQKEHVDYAAKLLVKLYDNDTFRFREYVQQEREYTEVKEGDVEILQKLWNDNQGLMQYLENHSKVNQRTLKSISGLDDQGFSRVINTLVSKSFIKLTQQDAIPVEKYRKAMKQIDRTTKIRTINIP